MQVALDQLRALDALARHGTFARAGEALRKRHTGVLYAIRQLEERLGLRLVDRSGYRTRLTPEGERVLEHGRRLLDAERALVAAAEELKTGWEPSLRLVFDGIFPVDPILRAVGEIARAGAPTRIDVSIEFLSGVERVFQEGADLMITVLPPATELRAVRLAPVRAVLVARHDHPLASGEVSPDELSRHVLLTVRGSDPRLQLSTAGLDPPIAVRLADFTSKKVALEDGLGFGWMPERMVARELARGRLARVRWRGGESVHVFEPKLCYRRGARLGKAASLVVERLRENARRPR